MLTLMGIAFSFIFRSDSSLYVLDMMKNYTKKSYGTFLRASIVVVALSAALLSSAPAHAQAIGQCLSGADSNAAVQSGTILKLPRVLQIAGVGRDSTLHNQRVCYVNNELAYVIDVINASGTTQQLILRGSDGSPYS